MDFSTGMSYLFRERIQHKNRIVIIVSLNCIERCRNWGRVTSQSPFFWLGRHQFSTYFNAIYGKLRLAQKNYFHYPTLVLYAHTSGDMFIVLFSSFS